MSYKYFASPHSIHGYYQASCEGQVVCLVSLESFNADVSAYHCAHAIAKILNERDDQTLSNIIRLETE